MKYVVGLGIKTWIEVEVNAKSKKEAIKKGREQWTTDLHELGRSEERMSEFDYVEEKDKTRWKDYEILKNGRVVKKDKKKVKKK